MEASSTGCYGRSESGQGGDAVGMSWTGGRARRGGRSCSRKEECKRPSVEIQQERGLSPYRTHERFSRKGGLYLIVEGLGA